MNVHTLATHHRSVIPFSPYPGLPSGAVVIEDASLVLVDVDGDGNEDITHDRRDGRTLILAASGFPACPKTVMRHGATYHHRFIPGVGIEVNVEPELDAFASAARNALTPEREESAEVTHAAAIIGFCGPVGSACSTMDWHSAGRISK